MLRRHHWKISHYKHTGRLRSHEHTSYLPLALLLVVVGAALTLFSTGVFAASPGPEAGSVGLSGSVPGDPPTEAATITSPNGGQRFSESPVTVSGTCPEGVLVEIFKNKIFAGSTPCKDDGTFSLKVDLLIGKNDLVARVYDALNQAGPGSNTVTTFFDALPPQADPIDSLNFSDKQLLLDTDAVYRGIFPGEELSIPIEILGGTPPYAVDVQWGDSSNKIIPRNNNAPFSASHTYETPGTYQLTLKATDSADRVAFLTVAAIVNGQPNYEPAATTETSDSNLVSQLLLLWPLYTAAATAVISFWLGEQREKRVLRRHGLLQPTHS